MHYPFLATLADQLGLEKDAAEADITKAITSLQGDGAGKTLTALQSQIGEIGVALGVADDADPTAILVAARAKPAGGIGDKAFVALQGELATVTRDLNTERETRQKKDAEDFVDSAIKDGRVGVKPMRDTYISMHMEDPSRAEKLIGAMPTLGTFTHMDGDPPEGEHVSLNAEELAGKAVAYQAKRANEGQQISITDAVRAVQEEKK